MNNGGCFSGILKILMLGWLFDWLQDNFGFGRGCSCSGCGCGVILTIIFIGLCCWVVVGTNWLQAGF